MSNDQTISGVLERVQETYPILAEEKNLLIALNEKYANSVHIFIPNFSSLIEIFNITAVLFRLKWHNQQTGIQG